MLDVEYADVDGGAEELDAMEAVLCPICLVFADLCFSHINPYPIK